MEQDRFNESEMLQNGREWKLLSPVPPMNQPFIDLWKLDHIIAYIILLNATIPEHVPTVASSRDGGPLHSTITLWGCIIDYHRHSLK